LPFLIGLNAALKVWRSMTPFFLGSSFGKLVTENSSWLANISGDTWMRVFGFFPDPHMFSFFAALCFFVGLGCFAREKNRNWRMLSGIGLIIMLAAIIFSFSRGAYMGIIAGSFFFLAILLIRLADSKKIIAIGIVLIISGAMFFQGTIQSRLTSAFNLREGSNAERIKNWRQAVEVVKDYPLTGIGLGNYSSYINPSAGERSPIYAHNLLLDIAAETGILNGILFFALLAMGIWRGISAGNFLGLGIASGFVYFLAHGVFDTPLWSLQVMMILLVMLALGVNNVKTQNSNVKTAT